MRSGCSCSLQHFSRPKVNTDEENHLQVNHHHQPELTVEDQLRLRFLWWRSELGILFRPAWKCVQNNRDLREKTQKTNLNRTQSASQASGEHKHGALVERNKICVQSDRFVRLAGDVWTGHRVRNCIWVSRLSQYSHWGLQYAQQCPAAWHHLHYFASGWSQGLHFLIRFCVLHPCLSRSASAPVRSQSNSSFPPQYQLKTLSSGVFPFTVTKILWIEY